MTLCEQCKHYNVDYVWDDADDEEYEEYTCSLSGETIDYAREVTILTSNRSGWTLI